MTETEITTLEQLESLVGAPGYRAAHKVRDALLPIDREWLAASPFCVLATADAEGRCDASPKGDPAGHLVHVLSERTIAIAERPGNKRVDGYRNVIVNPHVGLVFFVPGRGDTLRINGRARLVSDADFFDQLVVRGHHPILALVVEIEEVFHHCAKALMRSQLWQPETWNPDVLPSVAAITKAVVPNTPETLEQLESYYGPSYAASIYHQT
ncbi:MAG: pyridoxamine 5'-phosphate oxidase family protein [Micropruina sp.]|nr:pyridoxamine 5'-phosphate oxidase family protein [Micropruina sp.]